MKGTNEKWTKSKKINFREKFAKNVDLVHVSIGRFILSGTIKCGLSPLFHWCLQMYFSLSMPDTTTVNRWQSGLYPHTSLIGYRARKDFFLTQGLSAQAYAAIFLIKYTAYRRLLVRSVLSINY